MANPFRQYFSITPLVLRADDRPKEIVIHARQQHVQKFLDAAAQVKVIYMEGSVYVPHYRKWIQNSGPAPVRRGGNGDLILTAHTPAEGEYTIYLEQQKPDGAWAEVLTFVVYALREDLFRLRPYRGDFHMHSNRSDGRETPEYVAATCRRIGLDFMCLTDHHRYEPSLIAQKAMADFGCDMLVCPGEEVHLPDNPTHIVNFGGRASINAMVDADEAKYRAGVAEYMKDLPDGYDENTRFQVAASEWTYDCIRENGGIAMFCHPYWRPNYHNYIGLDVIDLMMERNRFDVMEAVGGFYRPQTESNMLSIARWQEERAKGRKIPVAGISDSHGCDGDLTGWFYTVVFAEKLEFESIAAAIRDERSLAVHWIPEEHPIVVGRFRLVKFVHFLLREFYPEHNELCRIEGEIMRRALAGEEPDAKELIARRKGTVARYMEQCWEK